jgi:hypothetical protein
VQQQQQQQQEEQQKVRQRMQQCTAAHMVAHSKATEHTPASQHVLSALCQWHVE